MIGWEGRRRGDICVVREVNGRYCVLRLIEPWTYREWIGCFSII